MWDLPGPGIELMSPTLAGRFFTTESPGKPFFFKLNKDYLNEKKKGHSEESF